MIPEKLNNYMFNEKDFFNEEYVCTDPEKEELVKKLANMITDDIGIRKPGDVQTWMPDFWILDRLLSKEEIKFMLSFGKKRVVKMLPEELAEKNGMTPEEAEAMAFKICEIGLMEFDRENPERRRQYFIPKWVVGSGEYMMMNSKLLKDHPEVATFFNYASSVPVGKVARLVPPGGGGLGMHVIPVEKAIEHESKSVSVEHLSHWLKKYDKYCVDVCSCRRQQAMRGEGVGDIEGYMCLAVGDMAEYIVETHKDAYYITYDEVMEILKRSEEK
ncbi:MAG: pyridine nucleotide-disulfide oxidoreductase, partial [Erysipelotrichaceae bacterium]|nr:pyridine nucleotide-disulfide oxidoreductase [Erysipelotrichaceae bacterium]